MRNKMIKLFSLLMSITILLSACSTNTEQINNTSEVSNIVEEVVNNTDNQKDNTEEEHGEAGLSIHFIDVGQADAALIECGGHYMLIDGGNREDSNLIYSVLSRNNIEYLDILVGTHAHEDHIGGLPGAFEYANVGTTMTPVLEYNSKVFSNFKHYAEEKSGEVLVPAIGDEYELGSATVEVIGVNGGEDTNDTSIVLMVTYGENKFLFTGDAEREAEQTILERVQFGYDISADVLKVGHHGAKTSTSYEFLRAVMPEYAVISVGSDNSYGHPTEETLSRLRDEEATVYRTDLQGDIYCYSDGTNIWFETDKNSNIDTLESVRKDNTEYAGNSTEDYVYITNSGSKYHIDKDCSGMENPNAVSKEEAEENGYSACKKCTDVE